MANALSDLRDDKGRAVTDLAEHSGDMAPA